MSLYTIRNRRQFISTAVIFATTIGFGGGVADASTPATGAQSLVEGFHKDIVTLLASGQTSRRAGEIGSAINQAFHMRLIARIVAGDAWANLNPETRQRLANAILEMNVATYVNQLGSIELVDHSIDGLRQGQQQTTLVDATLTARTGTLPLTYVTREIKGRWWIIDVLIEGKYSELSRRQAEYKGVIKQSGVDGLIQTLETKAAQLAAN